ncbi:MAG: thioredoxin family protein, partial [Gemmatimonadota bacterium]|nr:thioredoxin family protein [Gemmatimonadota bacterium]
MNRNVNYFLKLVLLAGCAATSLPAQQHSDKAQAPLVARELMQEALVKAKREHKGVLVKFSASWCGPCQQFDRFLNDTTGVGAIMHKHFEIVALTALEFAPKTALNNPGAIELSKEMGGDLETTGIPYFFMVDAAGRK